MSVATAHPAEQDTAHEHWTARFLKPILFVISTLAVFGVFLALQIPIAVFPSTDFPRIVVGIDNGVMPIDQMEITVTRPMEMALNSVPGLQRVRSITSRGSAEVDLFFSWNIDMIQTLQLVNAAVARAQPELPSTAVITANRLTFAAFPIMGFSLTSNTVPQTELWNLATYTLQPRLNRMEGVSTVVIQGGAQPEYAIQADPAKLVQTQTTVSNILDAVARGNLIDSPGLIEHQHALVLSLVSDQAHNATDLGQLAIKLSPDGTPIHIHDVAAVKPSVKPVYTAVTANAKPAVLLNIFRQPNSNTVRVADEVNAELAQIKKSLPSGVDVQSFYDQSTLVNDAIKSVRDAIIIGLILAAFTIMLFLRDWGSSLIAALVIPATIAVTFIALRLLGENFDLMTLGGLAAAVGLIIDDAIVVVENIVLHRDQGYPRGEAVRLALSEIRTPLVGSTVTPIVVFLPLVAITGVTGVFFRALAVTVGVALLTSLALALSWTPALSQLLLSEKRKKAHKDFSESRVTRIYDRAITLVAARPAILVLGCLAVVAISFFCYKGLGTDLLPSMDEGGFVLDYLMPAGSSLTDTNQVLEGVEKILHSIPEVDTTSRRTGLQLGLAAVTEANTGDFSVKLKSKRSRSVDQVIAEVREKVNEAYPQLDTDFTQVLQDMIGDLTSSPDPIDVKMFSENIDLLKQWAPQLGDALKKVPQIKDVKNGIENSVSGPAMTFHVKETAAARTGFTPQEVEIDTSALMQGEPAAAPVMVNGRPWTVRVVFPPANRANLDALLNTPLSSSTGRVATVGALSDIVYEPGQLEVQRDNLQRDVSVTGRLEGLSLGGGIQKVKQVVAGLHIPPAIRIEYGGLYATQQQSFHDLLLVLIMAIILIFTVLLIEFRAFSAAIAIVVSAVLSTSGVFVALLVTGTTFNVSSFMGLVMVVGIVAKNGILLLDAEQKFRAAGSNGRDAMRMAGERRLRPIFMTAMAAIVGMLPLSFAIGAGSELLKPLAIAVIGGILASIGLSLVVTPAVHWLLTRE